MFTESRNSLWEIYAETFDCRKGEVRWNSVLAFGKRTKRRREKNDPAVPSISRGCSAEAFRAAKARKFQILRTKVLTKRAGTRKAIPHQDGRILRSLSLFRTPRGTTRCTKIQRDA